MNTIVINFKMAIPFNLPSDESTLEQYRGIRQLLIDFMAILRALLGADQNIQNLHPTLSALHGSYFQSTPPSSTNSSGPSSPLFGASFTLPDVITSTTPSPRALNQASECYPESPSYRRPSAENVFSFRTTRRSSGRTKKAGKSKRKRKSVDEAVEHLANCGWAHQDKRKICSCFYNDSVDDRLVEHQPNLGSNQYFSDIPRDLPFGNSFASQMPKNNVPSWVLIGEELRKIVESFRNAPRKISDEATADAVKEPDFVSNLGRTVLATALILIGWKLLRQN